MMDVLFVAAKKELVDDYCLSRKQCRPEAHAHGHRRLLSGDHVRSQLPGCARSLSWRL
ncbi:MAG: hypothetical protein MZV70_37240 [Desulfobacterales bacterium]|nr:hypothetical protein [Desulfobacterales bacterium]